MDVLDVYDALMPHLQVVVEVDWSAGHAKEQEDGLAVKRMNINVGQERTKGFIPKTSGTGIADGGVVITEGCVHPGGQLHNIRVGGRQHFAFGRRDEMNPFEPNNVREKYGGAAAVGQPKGVRQILWERGFDVKGKKGDELRQTLAACEDFASEVGALEKRVVDRGHILLMSPKGHPELAGLGIEYCWAQSKNTFRRQNAMSAQRGEVVEDLHKRVVRAIGGVDVHQARRFARKTREYKRAYARFHGLFGWDSELERLEGHAAIEKFVKKAKTHRCILDQEYAFATA